MISASLEMSCALAVSARVPTVQERVFSSGHEALYTIAAGVSGAYPPSISLLLSSSRCPALRKITIVAPCAAKDSMLSFSGTGVLPAILVITTLCEIPGSVYSMLRAAAAPLKALTPGVVS